jgi:hypothetical protein
MPQKKKEKLDQLETFFIKETTHIIGLYDALKSSDPRGTAISDVNLTQEQEAEILKNSWAVLISYARIYGYKRFDDVDISLEKFFMEKINVQS